jgi:hypothetical protein
MSFLPTGGAEAPLRLRHGWSLAASRKAGSDLEAAAREAYGFSEKKGFVTGW